MRVLIESIKHREQRYETCGDYEEVQGTLIVRVSHTEDDYDFLVAVHELIEAYLVKKRGIPMAQVDAHDMAFEEERAPDNTDEPGDAPDCPYRSEHQFATLIERQVARELGVDWDAYEKRLNAL